MMEGTRPMRSHLARQVVYSDHVSHMRRGMGQIFIGYRLRFDAKYGFGYGFGFFHFFEIYSNDSRRGFKLIGQTADGFFFGVISKWRHHLKDDRDDRFIMSVRWPFHKRQGVTCSAASCRLAGSCPSSLIKTLVCSSSVAKISSSTSENFFFGSCCSPM